MSVQVNVPGAGTPAPEVTDNGHEPEQSSSLIASLRQAAQAQISEHTEEFPVGGEFGRQLWIRHKPLDPDAMDRFINRRAKLRDLQDSGKGDFPVTSLNLDLMAQSCVCMVGADVRGENKEDLVDSKGPIRLEHRLAVFLDLPVPPDGSLLSAREVIMMIFGQNGMAVVDYGDTLTDWMRDPTKQKPVGESSARSG